jgi:hypothetical protein
MSDMKWINWLGLVLILDSVASLIWGLSDFCTLCPNNSVIGQFVRVGRLLIGVSLVRTDT